MTILVTGASGFVGTAVVRALLARGETVRAMVRRSSATGNLDDLPIERAEADLTRPDTLATALKGCRALFHVAADYRLWARDPSQLYATNVEGTRALMQAALDAGVTRIVYTSSVAVLGIPKDGTPGDEETPVTLADMIGDYKRSKYLGEQVVAGMVHDHGLPAVIVNPSTPIGPRDIRPTPTGRMVLDAATGRMPAYVDTGLNVVHVDDVAAGHLAAFDRGEIGRRYVLGGENLPLRAILDRIAAIAGRRPPALCLPIAPLMPVGWCMQNLARLPGMPAPQITVESLRMARKKMFFSSERALRELDYRPRPANEALGDAIQWFRDHGMA